jgi:molybdenum cofactor biosynthesis protein B
MPGIDENRQFVPLKIAVLTVSDTREVGDDKSGATLIERIRAAGHVVAERSIAKDEVKAIRQRVKAWIADKFIDVVITTGGTGFTGRDVTPEAVEPLFEKKMDGFATMFLLVSEKKIGTSAIQTRATAGVANATYIFCLPGSPGAWCTSSTIVIGPAILWRSCRGSTSTCDVRNRRAQRRNPSGMPHEP